jgi:hypothetical protein
VKKKTFLKLCGWLAASAGLVGCAETPVTPPTTRPETAQPATTRPENSRPTTTNPVTAETVQVPAITTQYPTTTLPQGETTTLPVSPTALPTPPVTATASPAPTAMPTPTTQSSFSPVLKPVVPASSGYYFRFTANGRMVFYGRALNGSQTGTWAMTPGNPAWTFLTPNSGNFTTDLTLAALNDKAAGTTVITELSTGKVLATLQNRASSTIFSPDNKMIAYLLRSAQQAGPEQPQRFELWMSNPDGSQARTVWSGLEAGNLAWFPDNHHLLWTGRDSANRRSGLWVKNVAGGDNAGAYTIIESKGLTGAALSPDGQSVAYWVTLQGSEFSGVWLARSDGSQARKLPWVGGFRWADTGELLYVPVRQGRETASTLWSFNPATGQTSRLTGPDQVPLKIALDQWQVAPGGRSIVYRNADDNALWQLTFRA